MLLAGLMAKAGAYGLLRFCLPLFPEASRAFGPLLSGLAIVGILYGGSVAWAQGDMRRLLAYGSMSHMGFILLGIFALDATAVQGSLIQMINHGVSTGALFLLAGMLIERTGRARTQEYGGIAALVPALAAVAMIVVLSSLALPGTNGFIGEFLILLGTFQARPEAAVLATLGVVAAVAYLLGFVGRVFHGPVREDLRGMPDLRPRETAAVHPDHRGDPLGRLLPAAISRPERGHGQRGAAGALLSRVTASGSAGASRGGAGRPRPREQAAALAMPWGDLAHIATGARARRDRVRGPAGRYVGDRTAARGAARPGHHVAVAARRVRRARAERGAAGGSGRVRRACTSATT